MREARTILPTDLLALVTYNGRSYPNQAWTYERLGGPRDSALGIGAALDQFLAFARGRSVWINVHRQRLQGLVGARRRGARQAWEIDYLIDATPHREVVGAMLDAAAAEAGRSGAERIFIRLAADSGLLSVVQDAGYHLFRREVLYTSDAPILALDSAVRPVTAADNYPLFQLYCDTTSEAVRRHEAATYNQWLSTQERSWRKHGVQLVKESEGKIEAVVRAARQSHGVCLELQMRKHGVAEAAGLLGAATHALGSPGLLPYRVLLAEGGGLEGVLEEIGFSASDEFVSLVKWTAKPLKLPKLKTAMAKTAVGV